ncbi:SDR family oxidoreductase [Actinokineospora sp.]|uniref:SDR family oxidoreductase n=1 Tax=Actinokineospora sp. TaxID=1872133 RepID=UPI004037B1EF
MTGKVAVITGASSGVGAATARRLHAAGVNVVVGARRGDRLKELTADLDADRTAWVECDIRRSDDAHLLVETAVERFGGLDILVANAGIGAYGGILDYSDEEIEQIIDTNLTGTIWSVRAAAPHLLERGGDIVLVSSVAGLRGRADEAVYAATKHGLVGLAGSLDRELRGRDVRVVTLCPGAIATEFALSRGRCPEMAGLSEMLRPEDVAEMVHTVTSQPRSMRTLLWSMRGMSSEN